MKVLAFNPGHDGSAALLDDGKLIFAIEAEKDSYPRYSSINVKVVGRAFEMCQSIPDIVAIGGWHRNLNDHYSGRGYYGLENFDYREGSVFGTPVKYFYSSHERSHIYSTVALSPWAPLDECIILVWEGVFGNFYHWKDYGQDIKKYEVMTQPGAKYASIYALADPNFPDSGRSVTADHAGKLMALAGYALGGKVDPDIQRDVDCLLEEKTLYPFNKSNYRKSKLYNSGLHTEPVHMAAKYVTERIFEIFSIAAQKIGITGLPLLISGGCGLNCEWNTRWRDSRLFAEVFVPPCTNDSGSALGTGIDALSSLGYECKLDWNVYCGEEFIDDISTVPSGWKTINIDNRQIAVELKKGEIFAWVNGRSELGPRALGNRSILASPLIPENRDKLNQIKNREFFRPIAPCCLTEDVARLFEHDLDDHYMLYFNKVKSTQLPAITHVDGSARVQSVDKITNNALHSLLSEFKAETGFGVLCNTSLNFPGLGFINRLSELSIFCETRGIRNFVVRNKWYIKN